MRDKERERGKEKRKGGRERKGNAVNLTTGESR